MIFLGSKHPLKQETGCLLFTSSSPWYLCVDHQLCIVTATLHWLDLLRAWLMTTESREKARPQLCRLQNKLFRSGKNNPCSFRLRPSSETGLADRWAQQATTHLIAGVDSCRRADIASELIYSDLIGKIKR